MKPVKCRTPTPYPFKDEKEEEKIKQKILKSLKRIRDNYRAKFKLNKSKKIRFI
jgi:hypothetical protein